MSQLKLLPLALTFVFAAAPGCKNDKDGKADSGVTDTGTPDTGEVPDTGEGPEDAMVVDTGPGPCQHDQGGPDNRGCDPGEVCNLSMDPPQCVPGHACTTDNDCNVCSDLVNPQECGHGYHLTAWCDPNHGNVCTRSRAPCEPCETDSDCGRSHPITGGMNTCVEYAGGEKFCGRPCSQGCPAGFSCNQEGACFRPQGCAEDPVICPRDPDDGAGCGRMPPAQICPGVECGIPGQSPAPACATNDQPGALGICIGFCDSNDDCTDPGLPICNQRNGICIAGCTKGSCPANQVCHSDGFCDAPCTADSDCTDNPRYGPNTYCNLPPPPVRPPPRYYKGGAQGYRDDNACAPLGCERKTDCAVAGIVCDKTQLPPACVPGCYEGNDCRAGEACKRGEIGRQYSEQECRALETKPDGEGEIGTCCDPGCQDNALDCGFNQFCCGEDKDPATPEPYEDPATCLPRTATVATQALAGECFDMGTNPWCRVCMDNDTCNMPRSGWTSGYNDVDGSGPGGLVNEQEFCQGIDPMGPAAICTVTCNPDLFLAGVHTCPRLWTCSPLLIPCFQDADCNGLSCIGANPGMNIPGACRCGENGAATAVCPTTGLAGDVDAPRCIERGTQALQGPPGSADGEFYCVMAFNCLPPFLRVVDPNTGATNYPAACGL